MKTRLITIKRTVITEVPQKDGKTKLEKSIKVFPCKINAGVPFSHKMCEYGI